jgi:UDP-3-O-[3-hydroxymyristoyl] glucosamine N-acyltransferase
MKLSAIALQLGCRMAADSDVDIHRVAGIDDARAGDLTFVSNRKYISHLKHTSASAVILGEDMPEIPIPTLRTGNPYLAFAHALELFHTPISQDPGIHPSAQIAADAHIGPNPSIGAYAVVGRGCRIGANVVLYPHVVVYPEVVIGSDVVVHAHAVIRQQCVLGDRVTIQNGTIIGSDGFGFAPREDGTYYKIRQTGRVIVEDDVDIGSNTTIDRAAVGDTVVRRGVKLDNLVQVGHAVQIGANSIVAAQVGLAGSTRLGRNVRVGGQAGFAGHLTVGDNAVITAQSATSHDVAPGAVMSGTPAFDNAAWLRAVTAFSRLPDFVKRLRNLEKRVNRLCGGETAGS